jgi:epoxyqueuosine reductase
MPDAKAAIRAKALALGFDAVGFTAPGLGDEARTHLAEFLAEGLHGDMGWLAANAERRGTPRRVWSEARSVIVLGVNYGPESDPLAALDRKEEGTVSVYARGHDYHDVLKTRLKALGRWIDEALGAGVKVFVDTAPVMEKPLAARAGLGWQGKHTNLVSREFGSWLFLGEVFTTLDLAPDEAEVDHCGACRRCLDVCPTDAFPAPYRIDARRCISYLTIEHKGHIPRALRPAMGNRIYGCDDCLAVCPWNKFSRPHAEPAFVPREVLDPPRLAALARLDDAAFRAAFSKSPVKRTGRDRFVRNVLIAIGNSDEAALVDCVRARLDDSSPLVRAMAVWALSRLLDADAFALSRRDRLSRETDADVRAEWQSAP